MRKVVAHLIITLDGVVGFNAVADAITALKQQPGRNIGIHGSPTLVESLLQADLLDELRLEIYPVVASTGARLFHDGRPIKHLQLADSKITPKGVAILTFEAANNNQDAQHPK